VEHEMARDGNGGGRGKGPKPPKITDQAFATAENPTDGSTIGFVEADVRPDRSLWSILSGNDDGAYAIDPLTGELYVADGSLIDYETEQTRTLVVEVVENGKKAYSATITIDISDVNDAPVVDLIAQTNINETTDTSPIVANIAVSFTDADLTDTGHTATVTSTGTDGVIAGLTLDAAALAALVTPGAVIKAAGSTLGSVMLAFSAASTAFDYLAAGEMVTLSYSVLIDDMDGGQTSQSFDVVITGTADGIPISVEPDDYGIGTDLSTIVPGVTLSVEAQPDATVVSVTGSSGACGPDPTLAVPCASTGTQVFGASGLSAEFGPWQQNSGEFRADFDQPTDFVSIDLVGIDDGAAELRAFAADGTLLQTFHAFLTGPGDNVTASISRANPDIAYILVGGVIGERNNLDNLIFNRIAPPFPVDEIPAIEIFAGTVNDTLDGGGGVDRLSGGVGDDVFIFEDVGGTTTVIDFEGGAGAGDQLDVSAFGFANFAAFLLAASPSGPGGHDTLIQLDANDSILLEDFDLASLVADDVILF